MAKTLCVTAAMLALGVALAACGSSKSVKQGNEKFSIDEEAYVEALTKQDDAEFFHAIRAWSRVIDDQPRFAVAHFNIGLIYDQLNLVDEAIRHYEIAVGCVEDSMRIETDEVVQPREEIDASLAIYNLHLGTAYMRADFVDEARDALLKALELDPYNATVHYNLAACYMAMNQFDTALLHADNAVDLTAQPSAVNADGTKLAQSVNVEKLGMYILRQAECHLARKEWDKAHVAMKRAKEQCHVEAPPHLWDRWHAGKAAEEAAAEKSLEPESAGAEEDG